MLRALVEFRIRGVKVGPSALIGRSRMLMLTTLLFADQYSVPLPSVDPRRLHRWKDLDYCGYPFSFWCDTQVFISFISQFIDDTPELFKLVQSQNRAQKLLAYLGDLAVNGSSIAGQQGEPGLKDEIVVPTFQNRDDPNGAPLDCSVPCEKGWRNIIVEHGPEAFAKAVREYPGVLIMDTTWRDAHQSLLATRLRTIEMVNIAKETSHALANAYSLECWGGATFDVAMRFLYEDPWERLVSLYFL